MNHLLERVPFTRRNRVIEGFAKWNFRRNHATYFLAKCRTTQPTCDMKDKNLWEITKEMIMENGIVSQLESITLEF